VESTESDLCVIFPFALIPIQHRYLVRGDPLEDVGKLINEKTAKESIHRRHRVGNQGWRYMKIRMSIHTLVAY
jgi:hypothetical protein